MDGVFGHLLLPEWAASRQGPQNGVDEGPRCALCKLDRLVNRRVDRDLGQIKELVRSQSQEIPDFSLYCLKWAIEDCGEEEINRPALPQDSIAEFRRQRPVERRQPLPAELRVKKNIRVRLIPFDPDENL